MFYRLRRLFCATCLLSIGVNSTAAQENILQYESLSLLDVIKISLENNNQIKISEVFANVSEQNIEIQEGQFDSQIQASGTFTGAENPTQNPQSSVLNIIGVDNQSSSFSGGIQKRLKSSALVSLTMSSDATGDEFSGQNFNESGSSVLGFNVTLPLWKGRGSYLTTLPLELAKLNFDASTLDLKHQIDINIFQTVANYWNYRGASETLTLLREAEKRSGKMLADIQALIDADELPRSELNVVKAQLSQRRGARLRGEQNFIDAKATLTGNLGIVLPASTDKNMPTTKLAEPDTSREAYGSLQPEALMRSTMLLRNDFSALNVRIDIASKQIELANDATKPTLNFVAGGNYKTFESNNSPFSSLNAHSYGPDWSVGISYSYALKQISAKANKQIAFLGLTQRKIEKNELQRATTADLNSALFGFIQSSKRHAEALERHQLSVQNLASERNKFSLDAATILDILTIENQLLQSELDVIQQRVNYGSILVRLMFVTGRLGDAANESFNIKELRTGKGFIEALIRN